MAAVCAWADYRYTVTMVPVLFQSGSRHRICTIEGSWLHQYGLYPLHCRPLKPPNSHRQGVLTLHMGFESRWRRRTGHDRLEPFCHNPLALFASIMPREVPGPACDRLSKIRGLNRRPLSHLILNEIHPQFYIKQLNKRVSAGGVVGRSSRQFATHHQTT